MIKILNLYAGLGGNRKLWEGDIKVTAVENNPKIASIYKDFFPNDEVIVADAHQYLLEHYEEFDFIWSSPPCPTHSKVAFIGTYSKEGEINYRPKYPDMKLYEEILFLQGYFKGEWVVENVISWYEPLIKPFTYKQHYYWASFIITGKKFANRCHYYGNAKLSELKGFDLSSYNGINKTQLLRNCVEPESGLALFRMAFTTKQVQLFK